MDTQQGWEERFFGSGKDTEISGSLRSQKNVPPSGNFPSGEAAKNTVMVLWSAPRSQPCQRFLKMEQGIETEWLQSGSVCVAQGSGWPSVMPLLVELPQCFGHAKLWHPVPSIPGTRSPGIMILNFPPAERNRHRLSRK